MQQAVNEVNGRTLLYEQQRSSINQFGFRTEHSLYLEKSVDKIRQSLLMKMKEANFPPMILKTIRSYLKDRRFHTIVNGVESSERAMVSGVPQGLVLAPVLFTMYIRDIPSIDDSRVLNAIYADDTALHTGAPSRR
ncbi:hypothetical protein AMK59_191 [Oryctes borbonicus]|uniref:Reverse transcriptase domain-containing protein n=1 Tax=Oryctes borbonicus TaxID=1629725 RepID=A0A0T6BGC4_9SCAR|nr:hypothetical protein AMK59_191 [Oryctes borbonicus]